MKSCRPSRAPQKRGRTPLGEVLAALRGMLALVALIVPMVPIALIVPIALTVAAPAAQAAGSTPVLPALQSLINSATVNTAPAAASGASAADAASAPSPASQAELNRSLDTVISTLDNERQRTALVTQLKKLRDATQTVGPAQPAAPSPGLLGAIAAGIASMETDVSASRSPTHYWAGRFNAAGNELYTIIVSEGRETLGRIVLDMTAMLAGWGVCSWLLIYMQHRIHRRYGIVERLTPNPTTPDLLVFALRRVGPWIVAFLAALLVTRSMPDSLGRTVAMVIAYAIVAGAVFSSICLIMFSLFGTGHRRVAVYLLLRHARRLLWVIGICSALGDAAVNYDVAHQIGSNLAALISTGANMTAAVLTGYFALAFRRPVAHLIRDRSYDKRQNHKVATEAFDVLASMWHLPMLLLATASVVATLAGLDSSENVLQISVVTALLLVLAFFLSAVVLRVTRPRPNRRFLRRSPYLSRLLQFTGTLLTLFIWLAFFEFSSRLWNVSLAAIIEESVTARGIAHAMSAIVATVFLSWLLWIIIDTAILEAMNPTGPRSKAPSMRARTMLPLLRNAILVTILTVGGIVTAANLGINVTPLLAGAGVIGLAIGFGAQSLVTDLITGLFIIIEDTISVGDWIDIDGGHAGTVEHLSIRTVRLRDGQGAIHAIPFSQIKIVKNLSRDFAYAVFEVRMPFSADVDEVTRLIREVGAELMADFRYRREMLGPVEVWGLDRFDPNWMVVKGQIKTRPLKQWSVARAFNLQLKRKMDDAGIEIPVPQMHIYTSAKDQAGETVDDMLIVEPQVAMAGAAGGSAAGSSVGSSVGSSRAPVHEPAMAPARDVSHESRPAPPSTGPAPVAPQIPTAGDGGHAV